MRRPTVRIRLSAPGVIPKWPKGAVSKTARRVKPRESSNLSHSAKFYLNYGQPCPTKTQRVRYNINTNKYFAHAVDECKSVTSCLRVGIVGSTPTDGINIGVSPSGKAQDFDSCIRWFKSSYPSQRSVCPAALDCM